MAARLPAFGICSTYPPRVTGPTHESAPGIDRFEYAYLDYVVATIGQGRPTHPAEYLRVAALTDNAENMAVAPNAPPKLQLLNAYGARGWQVLSETTFNYAYPMAETLLMETRKTRPEVDGVAPQFDRFLLMRRVW